MSPGVRIEYGRLKNRLPAVRRGRHFPQAGNRAFSQVVRLFFVAAHRLPFRKVITSENCGFVLSTKCGPCRTARKQFSKGLRSKTGVQQHPKNTQKRLFRQAAAPSEREPFRFALARQPSSTTAYDRLATTFKTFSTGPWDASGVTAIANASITGQPTFSAGWSFI